MQPTAPPQTPKELHFLKPAITGGLFLGALSAIPFVNLGCCLWIPGGGGIGAWLLDKQRPGGLKYGDGALVGVLSGLVGTIVSTLINIPVQAAMFTPAFVAQMHEQLKQARQIWPDLPPDFETSMAPFFTPGFNLARLLMGAISFSILGGLLAMIGGILMVALQKRRRTPADHANGSPSA